YWLRPGAFCDVSIPVGSTRKAAVIPELAIRASEKGFLTYVVQGTVAKERVVSLGMHTSNGYVEVTSGLSPGDLLVVRGTEPLTHGAPVKVSDKTTLEAFDAGASAAPASDAGDTPPPGDAPPSDAPPAGSAPSGQHRRRDAGAAP